MSFPKVSVRKLPIVLPPIPEGGGRLMSPVGELTQIINGDSFRFLAYIEFKPHTKAVRGNHYHLVKIETLYIISGRLQAHYIDLDTDKRFSTQLETGDFVTVQPNCAHVYEVLEHTHAIEVTRDVYNPTDTIPHAVYNVEDWNR